MASPMKGIGSSKNPDEKLSSVGCDRSSWAVSQLHGLHAGWVDKEVCRGRVTFGLAP